MLIIWELDFRTWVCVLERGGVLALGVPALSDLDTPYFLRYLGMATC